MKIQLKFMALSRFCICMPVANCAYVWRTFASVWVWISKTRWIRWIFYAWLNVGEKKICRQLRKFTYTKIKNCSVKLLVCPVTNTFSISIGISYVLCFVCVCVVLVEIDEMVLPEKKTGILALKSSFFFCSAYDGVWRTTYKNSCRAYTQTDTATDMYTTIGFQYACIFASKFLARLLLESLNFWCMVCMQTPVNSRFAYTHTEHFKHRHKYGRVVQSNRVVLIASKKQEQRQNSTSHERRRRQADEVLIKKSEWERVCVHCRHIKF